MNRLLATILIILACLQSIYALDSIGVDSLKAKPVHIYNPFKYKMQTEKYLKIHPESKYIDPLDVPVDYNKLLIFGGVALGIGTAVHIYQANAWWQEQGGKFHVVNDWHYALWIDKVGHFYGTHLLAHAFSGAYDAANMQAEQSAIYSAISALAFELFIEIEDGFGPDWGFSPGDAMFDVLGASFYLAQYYYPYLKNFQPRVSYYPSKEFRDGNHKSGIIIDDYEGQKYWIGMRMKNILPDKLAEYWPSYLMVSVGMAVRNLDGSGGGTQSFYLDLDLDAEEIPLYGGFWQFVKNTLNYIHFPMPGIRITPNTAFFGFVF